MVEITALFAGLSSFTELTHDLGAPARSRLSSALSPLRSARADCSALGAALVFLDQSAVRGPILILTTLAALANLYTVWRARKLSAEAKVGEHLKTMTTLEKRRTIFVASAALATLGIVAFEIIAHILMHSGT